MIKKKIVVKVLQAGMVLLCHKINIKLAFTVSVSFIISFILNEKGLALNGYGFEAESLLYYLISAIMLILGLYYATNVIGTESPKGRGRIIELILALLIIGISLSLLIRLIFGHRFDIALLKSFDVLVEFMGTFTLVYECVTKINEREKTC